jgi:cell division protein FtsN
VQLGSFASLANAQRLARQLTGEGFRVSVSGNSVAGHTLYRVRAVTTGDRAAMQALAERLRVAGHSGTVLPRQ